MPWPFLIVDPFNGSDFVLAHALADAIYFFKFEWQVRTAWKPIQTTSRAGSTIKKKENIPELLKDVRSQLGLSQGDLAPAHVDNKPEAALLFMADSQLPTSLKTEWLKEAENAGNRFHQIRPAAR
jgi:hypothetical protein